MRSYLDDCYILLPDQFGFVPGKGVTEQHLEFLNLWCLSVSNNSGLYCTYLILRKHSILCTMQFIAFIY